MNIDREDAQEWLESLQQVGEGWYRQVALAVKAGAPNALGMERREFAARIGQKLIDPRAAIIELFNEGHSQRAIADILGVSIERTVNRVLAEEGLIEWRPSVAQKALEQRTVPEGHTATGGTVPEGHTADEPTSEDDLYAENERLTIEMKAQQTKHKQEVKSLKDHVSKLQRHLVDAEREARAKAQAGLTEQERERARKEAEAWAEEQGHKVLAAMAPLTVQNITGALEEAAEGVRKLIDQEAVTAEGIGRIEAAHAGFVEEFNVARMAVNIER